LKLDILLRGSKVRETVNDQLPKRISEGTRKAVDDVVNTITKPFRHEEVTFPSVVRILKQNPVN